MGSTAFEEAVAAHDAIDVALDKIDALDLETLSTAQRMELLERNETGRRRLPALCHDLLNQLGAQATRQELGGSLKVALAERLRIDRPEAARRIHEAADLGARRTMTGQPLPARLDATAAAQRAGLIGGEHVAIIRGFMHQLPDAVDAGAREEAQRQLADYATRACPAELRGFAAGLALRLNPDGTYTDEDRARRRGIVIGRQCIDGMSKISGYLTPEARAGLDAVFAKWAAPGMCNPAEDTPTVTGTPSEEAIRADRRSRAQRNHDALAAMVRSTLMSGEMGTSHGLPVTIIATAKLEDLQAKTGVANTASGSVLPIKDVLRMAGHAYNFLLLFDKAKRCQLYKGRDSRLATPAQRLVLYATERGCSRPGCSVPAAWCQVHHANTDWAHGGHTDIDNLTLACGPDNRLINNDGWTTRKPPAGSTEWIPPPHLDRGQPRTNTFHHPERMLRGDDDDEPAA
jgi:hypothetical protein